MTIPLVVVGMNHRHAPIEVRERFAVAPDAVEARARDVAALDSVAEAMFLGTCNRVELWAVGDDPGTVARSLRDFLEHRGGAALGPSLYEHRGDAALAHAFRVCASLDSMVVGEPQILGQVKEAFAAARTAGVAGATLVRVMNRAFQAAKRVRTETGIAGGQVSVASVAVDLARGIFDDLAGRTVLVVGAGKMALGAARSLVRQGASLAVANRNRDRAAQLVAEQGGTAHGLDELAVLLQRVDVVVCSTGAAGYVLRRDDVHAAMRVRRGRPLFLIDVGVPRNIDPGAGDLDSVYLYNVDDLDRIVTEGAAGRQGAREAAERVVDEELDAFRRELAALGVAPTIAALRERFRSTAQAELERSLGGRLKHLGDDDRKALAVMCDAMVNKLLHRATVTLRTCATEPGGASAIEVVHALFGLDKPEQGRDSMSAGNGNGVAAGARGSIPDEAPSLPPGGRDPAPSVEANEVDVEGGMR